MFCFCIPFYFLIFCHVRNQSINEIKVKHASNRFFGFTSINIAQVICEIQLSHMKLYALDNPDCHFSRAGWQRGWCQRVKQAPSTALMQRSKFSQSRSHQQPYDINSDERIAQKCRRRVSSWSSRRGRMTARLRQTGAASDHQPPRHTGSENRWQFVCLLINSESVGGAFTIR